jgi:hypothetical protein
MRRLLNDEWGDVTLVISRSEFLARKIDPRLKGKQDYQLASWFGK